MPTLLIALFALSLLTACDNAPQSAAAPPEMPKPTVTVAQPLVTDIQDWDEFTGRFEPVEQVDVRARVGGYLQSADFREGAMVNKGDLLFVVDPRPYEAALRQAQADAQAADAQLKFANAELARAENLRGSGTVPERFLEERRQAQLTATGNLAAARARADQARLNVEFTRVTAPISGRVSNKFVTEGNLITGGTADSTLLTRIVSLNPIHFVFDVDEQTYLKYARLAQNGERPSSRDHANPAFVTLADDNSFSHAGKMDFVDNQIDRGTGTMRGRAVFENTNLLLAPGMFGRIRIIGSGHYQGMLVPDEAIGNDQGRRFVYLVDETGAVQPRPITLGRAIGNMRVVLTGLAPTDQLVVRGLQRVRPGAQVIVESSTLELPPELLQMRLDQGEQPTPPAPAAAEVVPTTESSPAAPAPEAAPVAP